MVKLHSPRVFMKDPIDAWGKDRTIGLSELAVRMHAPPLSFDRRGDIIFYDDFEDTPLKFTSAGTGTAVRSNTTARNRSFSLECTTEATQDRYAGATYYLTDFHTDGKIGMQTTFASAAFDYAIRLTNAYCDGTNYHMAYIKYIYSSGTLQYQDSGGLWATIATGVSYAADLKNWATLKVVFDISTDKFTRLLAFGNEYDLSAYDMPSAASGLGPYLYVSAEIHKLDAGGVAKIGHFDNIVVTENEPA